MKITELIEVLAHLHEQHGEIEVKFYNMTSYDGMANSIPIKSTRYYHSIDRIGQEIGTTKEMIILC